MAKNTQIMRDETHCCLRSGQVRSCHVTFRASCFSAYLSRVPLYRTEKKGGGNGGGGMGEFYIKLCFVGHKVKDHSDNEIEETCCCQYMGYSI